MDIKRKTHAHTQGMEPYKDNPKKHKQQPKPKKVLN